MPLAILVIEDEATLAQNIATFMAMRGYEVHVAGTARSGLAAYFKIKPDVTLLDLRLPDGSGVDLLRRLRRADGAAAVIMMTAFGDVETAVEAMKAGACDFLRKPLSLSAVKVLVERALDRARTQSAVGHLNRDRGIAGQLDAIVGRSDPIAALKKQIERLTEAERNLDRAAAPPVLITGETGSGKELVARVLHQTGPYSAGPFLELNCAALPTDLVESELFGHEKGAFTGAQGQKIGLFEAAEGGALFLDEIGEMSLETQAKILKVMDDRMVRRVGGTRARPANVRFIAATNRDLEAAAAAGAFRDDLLFRLSVVRLRVPPLRERGEDVILLAEHYLRRLAQRYGRAPQTLSDEAARRLLGYAWPGNVRELRNVLERVTLFSKGSVVGPAEIDLPKPAAAPATRAAPRCRAAAPDVAVRRTADDLRALETELLSDALRNSGWNVSKAARILHLTRDQVRYKIRKHGLSQAAH